MDRAKPILDFLFLLICSAILLGVFRALEAICR